MIFILMVAAVAAAAAAAREGGKEPCSQGNVFWRNLWDMVSPLGNDLVYVMGPADPKTMKPMPCDSCKTYNKTAPPEVRCAQLETLGIRASLAAVLCIKIGRWVPRWLLWYDNARFFALERCPKPLKRVEAMAVSARFEECEMATHLMQCAGWQLVLEWKTLLLTGVVMVVVLFIQAFLCIGCCFCGLVNSRADE